MNDTETKLIPVPKPGRKESIPVEKPKEFGGPKGLEPTRYGDWEHNGRCSDF